MWSTIKQILKKNRGTCIIIEDGQPAFIVAPFDDYQKLLEGEPVSRSAGRLKDGLGESELLEKINQEIGDWKARQSENVPEVQLADIQASDELRIENLPLA